MEKSEDSLRDLWNISKQTNIHSIEISEKEEREKGEERKEKKNKRMAENVPKLGKEIDIQL